MTTVTIYLTNIINKITDNLPKSTSYMNSFHIFNFLKTALNIYEHKTLAYNNGQIALFKGMSQ